VEGCTGVGQYGARQHYQGREEGGQAAAGFAHGFCCLLREFVGYDGLVTFLKKI
jgi:hypothetical protein